MKKAIGDQKVLDRKTPSNPRYAHIRASVSTGSSLANKVRDIEAKKRDGEIAGNADETFKRISPASLARLLLSSTTEYDLEEYERRLHPSSTPSSPQIAPISIVQAMKPHAGTNNPQAHGVADLLKRPPSSELSNSLDSYSNGTNMSSSTAAATSADISESGILPFLLLDVRDKDDYATCHIVTSSSYPSTTPGRTMTQISRTLLAYKSPSISPIIVYDTDGESRGPATSVAIFLLERGWDNVRVLSGGLVKFTERFQGAIIGIPPKPKVAPILRKSSAPASIPSGKIAPAAEGQSSLFSNTTSMAPTPATSKSISTFSMKAVTDSLPRQFDLYALKEAVELAASSASCAPTPASTRPSSRAPSQASSRLTSRATSPRPGQRSAVRVSGGLRR
ncbi:hypothetical protein SmJEL517_g04906 [Synchytrium microbalum]|uniref:Rhodanese domain-containing protein n=1 Tax=Synchytrium microbalum TaxID=1806994 RepID=A0A507BWN2_9FUNG|nr:uncharacterized protein SmJEL517_g04906 [Synchytrium microbalum]TPX31862.1 hypothetical protein SmJEL517_g04906 [Synchytrium microbalum]